MRAPKLSICITALFGLSPICGCLFLKVWRALLKEMPLQSVLRFLGKMTSNKILEPGSAETQAVCDRIQCEMTLKKVGPINLAYHVNRI